MDEHASLVDLREWRWSAELDEQFACIGKLHRAVKPAPWPNKTDHPLPEHAVRPWLFPEVYQSLQVQERELPAELRPVAALFMRFGGIDYLDPDAGRILVELPPVALAVTADGVRCRPLRDIARRQRHLPPDGPAPARGRRSLA